MNIVCIYLDSGGVCMAHPPHVKTEYKPDEETLNAYCKNDEDMNACPRRHMYEDYLEALGKRETNE